MNKKNIIKVLVFVLIVIFAILFMLLGAKEEGRKYNLEEVKDYKYFVIETDGKYGVIDKEAKIIIETQYENVIIPNPSKAVFFCIEENNEIKILNEKKEEKFTEFEEVAYIKLKNQEQELPYEKSILRYKQNEKYGLMDYAGSKITEPIYDQIESLGYKEGEFIVEQNGKYGVINLKGINLVPIEYQTIKADEYYNEEKYYKDGYIVGIKTKEGYRYGYIDVEGNKLLDNEFNEISRLPSIPEYEGIYLVASKNGQCGLYKNKEIILNHNYQSITYNEENNILLLEKSKKYGVSDIYGNTILDVKYSQIDINWKYLYAKDFNEKTEVYDLKGKLTNIPSNTSKHEVADGKYTIKIVSEDDKTLYGIEDKNEKEIIEPKYTYIEYLFQDYFIVCNEEGKQGIINEKGETVLEIKYDSIQKIKDKNLIEVKEENEGSTQTYSEKMEIVPQKEKTKNENAQYLPTVKEGKWGFEDENGEIKVECIYDYATEFNKHGIAGIKKDEKWGVINKDLKVILEPIYEIQNYEKFFGLN